MAIIGDKSPPSGLPFLEVNGDLSLEAVDDADRKSRKLWRRVGVSRIGPGDPGRLPETTATSVMYNNTMRASPAVH